MKTELPPAAARPRPAASIDDLWKLPEASADPNNMFYPKDLDEFVVLLGLSEEPEQGAPSYENTGAQVIAVMDASWTWSVEDSSDAAIVHYESLLEDIEEFMIAQEAYGHYQQTPFEDTISCAEYAEQWLSED